MRSRVVCAATSAAIVATMTATMPGATASEALTFSDATVIAAPADPQRVSDVSSADVNVDGLTDVLVSSSNNDSGATDSGVLSVYLTQASGGLSHAGDYPAGSRAMGVATGDLNGDGWLDAVTTTYNGFSVLRGRGDGTFGDPVHHAAGNLREPVVADFNGDGWPDIAAANYYYGSFLGAVDVLLNNGDGTFASSRVDLGVNTFPGRLTAGDLNGDGALDLVATNGAFHVLIGNGDGTFAAPVRHDWKYTNFFGQTNFPASISDVTIGDFNSDGYADLAAASTNDTAAGLWFFPGAEDGSLNLAGAVSRRINDSAETIASADVDQDGLLDVVIGAGDGAYAPAVVNVRAGSDPWPTLGYKGPGGYVSDTYPRARIAVVDVNGDSYPDLVTVDQVKRLLLVRTQDAPPPPPPNGPPNIVIATPADGDAYEQGLAVAADYGCTDDGVVASCDGSVAVGDQIDTSNVGQQTFEVTATDDDGATATDSVTYEVLPAEPPTVTITVPQHGARYKVGEDVTADYVCDDGAGSGVQNCAGDVPAGDLIDTTSVGTHTFTVDAVDEVGLSTREAVSYDVVPADTADTDPPVIRIASPIDGTTFDQGDTATAVYECEDFGSGIDYCDAPVASGALLDTSTGGDHRFVVEAADLAGNWSQREVVYYVNAGPPPPDVTAPYVVFDTPQYDGRYPTGSDYTVSYTCMEFGASRSGVASCTGTVANGSKLDTATPGRKTITVTTSDNAGNTRSAAISYEVIDDADGDGLSDLWETAGVDIDKDGTIDLALNEAPYNANPERRDVFVEMDYMTCQLPPATCAAGDLTTHAPQAGVAADVVQAFSDAPGGNPDGSTGIALHLLVDEAVPEISEVNWYPSSASAYDDVEDIKAGPEGPCNGAFGTEAERLAPDCEKLLKAKAQVYRWGLFGHLYAENYGSSGIAEYPGNDFLVSVGGQAEAWTRAAGSLGAAESGTILHELGHTFGLGHGGPSNDVNCKPNYLSVMNYSLQVGYYDPTRPLDYSRAALPTLNEDALDEVVGVGGPVGRNTVYGVNGAAHVAPASGGIDWNDDGTIAGIVAGNPNSVGECPSPANEQLSGADDWSALLYSFNVSPDFASGARFTSTTLVQTEVTHVEAVAAAESSDFDGDGVSNAVDVCRADADPQQLDLDGDGTGNACDAVNSITIQVTPEQGTVLRIRQKFIQVAVLGTTRFATSSLDIKSLRFGQTGSEAAAASCSSRDVNADKRSDLSCLFPLAKTGLAVGRSTAVLNGRTTTSVSVTGSASVRIVA